ncbi:winged helix-turn-helix domain-containing protein [Liquorilactobacillus vini]|uniref:Uncharacterized protein n=1 Tax=Liquorilactobacillus vini DSM 20605 TaxID=1133569 RepID=A0A0R2CL66_9LACO|nr:helix-turn-helix domain-containing protein [Liquorilactobacillus vini]KRM88988.1 hypothetical protein FD21_GL000450 [Liquorilactobacillus vini DSM 20605]
MIADQLSQGKQLSFDSVPNEFFKFAKLLADEKVIAILSAAKDPQGLTSKEISRKVKIPVNQLYYTVKKLVNAKMLQVTQKKTINNFQEFFYSSYRMFHQTAKVLAANEQLEDQTDLKIAPEWAKEHQAEILQLILYQDQQFIATLQKELATYQNQPSELSTFFVSSSLTLSKDAEKNFEAELFKLIKKAQVASKNAKQVRTVKLVIKKWPDQQD